MRTVFGMCTVLAAIMMLAGGFALADDRAEIADLQARIATLEAKMMAPSGGGDAESLTSLRKKGAIKIGGAIELDVRVGRRDEANDSEDSIDYTSTPGGMQNGDFADIDLDIQVDAGPDSYLFIKLDLDDTGTDDNLVEEANFVWKNVRGSNWTVILGKDETFFGQDRDHMITDPLVHGDNDSMIANAVMNADGKAEKTIAALTQAGGAATNGPPLKREWESNVYERGLVSASLAANTGSDAWQGELDNVVHVGAQYKFRELAKLELAVFQNAANVYEDRARDNGLESAAARLWIYPIEGMKLELSAINRHDDRFDRDNGMSSLNAMATSIPQIGVRKEGWGDYDIDSVSNRITNALQNIINQRRMAGQMTLQQWQAMSSNVTGVTDPLTTTAAAAGPAATGSWRAAMNPNVQAISVGFDYTAPSGKWELFGELTHTWNAAHFEDLSSTVTSVGLVYALTEKIDLLVGGDWASIDNDVFDYHNAQLAFDEDLYDAKIGASYTLDNGIKFMIEYKHEWYTNDLEGWEALEADQVAFRTAWTF